MIQSNESEEHQPYGMTSEIMDKQQEGIVHLFGQTYFRRNKSKVEQIPILILR